MEDDDAAHYILELAFRELGSNFHVHRVTDGLQALQFLTRAQPFTDAPRPDLVLSNLNMPGMTGIELLGELQKDERWKDIPVVVFSSSRLTADRAECLVRGAKEFITKPQNFDDVVAVLRHICRHMDGTLKAGAD